MLTLQSDSVDLEIIWISNSKQISKEEKKVRQLNLDIDFI